MLGQETLELPAAVRSQTARASARAAFIGDGGQERLDIVPCGLGLQLCHGRPLPAGFVRTICRVGRIGPQLTQHMGGQRRRSALDLYESEVIRRMRNRTCNRLLQKRWCCMMGPAGLREAAEMVHAGDYDALP
jgi:hypothetical protein